jgi:hypothetical protein
MSILLRVNMCCKYVYINERVMIASIVNQSTDV